MSKNLKIEDWYNLYCDNNIKHSDIIEDIYKKLIYFINHNKFILDLSNEKEFKGKFIHFLYKYSTKTKYKYF